MTEHAPVSETRARFDETIIALSASDPDAAVVVLTMARLAAQAMLGGDTGFASAAARVVDPARSPARPAARARTAPSTTRSRPIRNPAALDPFQLYRSDGKAGLQSRLAALELEQLRDIIHQFGMDPDKRAMKWKTIAKVRERIVESTEATRNRDNAFH